MSSVGSVAVALAVGSLYFAVAGLTHGWELWFLMVCGSVWTLAGLLAWWRGEP